MKILLWIAGTALSLPWVAAVSMHLLRGSWVYARWSEYWVWAQSTAFRLMQ